MAAGKGVLVVTGVGEPEHGSQVGGLVGAVVVSRDGSAVVDLQQGLQVGGLVGAVADSSLRAQH